MHPELRFDTSPAPSPPRILNPTGGQGIRYPRGFPLQGPRFPTNAGGGSLPLPPLPPIRPINLAPLAAPLGGAGLLFVLDLLFPASLADGELPPGLQPLPERARVPDVPVESVDGEWFYDAVKSITLGTQQVSYYEPEDRYLYSNGGLTLDIPLTPTGSTVMVKTTNTRTESIPDCTDCEGIDYNSPHLSVTHFDMDFEELDDYSIGMPNGREESEHGGYGWSTYTVWVEKVEYYSPDELEPEAWPPGPYTPQPEPIQPGTGIKTKPLTTTIEPLAAEPQTVPLQATTTTVVPVAPKRIAPLPPGPEPIPELQPEEQAVPSPAPLVAPVPVVPKQALPMPQTGSAPVLPPAAPPITPPDHHFPTPGGPGIPGNGPPPTPGGISKELGRIEAKSANLLEQLGSIAEILGFLGDLLPEEPTEPVDPNTYFLTGVCEEPDEFGEQPVFGVPVLGGDFQTAAISRLDAMQYLLQAHLGYKTPTCSATKPKLEGTWISTRWVSDGDSPASTSRLRKLFRYRSKSTRDADELRAFWSGFTWQAGPIMVEHTGAWWGTPQVWAASAEEGKRIIRFAAGEAGIDPDLDGEWRVATSDSPRYGQPGTMRLASKKGVYWATRRDTPNGPAVS